MPKLIGIIGGKGKMGAYFKKFFEKNGYSVMVSDVDTEKTNIELAKQSDVVVISVPIGLTAQIIDEVTPYLKEDSLLMDLTSLKSLPMDHMKKTKGAYLGCHPMFGPTNSIEGQMVILCEGRGKAGYNWWKNLLKENKVEIHEMTAERHDDLMSYVQALSHFSDLVLSDALSGSGIEISDFLKYQSPPYRLKLNMMGRILNQNPNLYGQIQIQNPKSLKVMADFKKSAEDWIDIVQKKDLSAFESKFKKASGYLGEYKRVAMEESDFLIEQINRRKISGSDDDLFVEPDESFDLVVLGPENTFSSMAAKKYAPDTKIYYTRSITEVFEILKSGVIKRGMVPIENKLAGSVAETMSNLFESHLMIQDEFYLPIHHYLVALDEIDTSKIKRLYSHPQPIKQCKKYLSTHLSGVDQIKVASTTAAVKKLILDSDYQGVAICSEEAVEAFNLKVIDSNIEDYAYNQTRFFILGKERVKNPPIKSFKTSMAFTFSADAPGSLHQVLSKFSEAGVNMTKIESLANPAMPGGHVFYIEFDGHQEDPVIQSMLSLIEEEVVELKIMGSY